MKCECGVLLAGAVLAGVILGSVRCFGSGKKRRSKKDLLHLIYPVMGQDETQGGVYFE
jgi:hypothetical protein